MTECRLMLGDCLEVMKTLEANSVHAIICDPPYALTNRVPDEVRCSGCGWVPGGSFGNGQPGEACTKCGAELTRTRNYRGKGFMGKDWDTGRVAFEPEVWAECLRVAKPGAMLLAFGGDRTHHRLMVAIEDAGWQIRTCLYWLTGSGFPKSRNIGKAIRSEFSADVLCACDQRSTQTVQDSQDDCPEYHHSHDGQLHVDQDSGLDVSQQSTDARVHNRADLHGDVQASTQANIYPGAANAHPSNGYSSHPLPHLSTAFQDGDSSLSGTPLNMSSVFERESHKTDSHKSDKFGLGHDSASSLSSPDNVTHSHLPYCTTCGKPIASAWDGFGTALKPAAEIIVMAMKPLDGTFANNALVHGVGGLNIDACRIETAQTDDYGRSTTKSDGRVSLNRHDGWKSHLSGDAPYTPSAQGRWPANLLLDDQAAQLLDEMSGERMHGAGHARTGKFGGDYNASSYDMSGPREMGRYGDTGGASRFFLRVAHDEDDVPLRFLYCAKASKRDRDEGLEGMEFKANTFANGTRRRCVVHDSPVTSGANHYSCGCAITYDEPRESVSARNHHPTVKPTALMKYLCRLVCPPNGTILDPFMGSGSTGKAAKLEGFHFVGIEIDAEYLAIAEKRIAAAQPEMKAQLPLLELAGAEEVL